MTRKNPHPLEMLTLGVEEEFMLVDPATRITVPRAPEVRALATPRLGERVAPELYATQIEAHTRPAKQVKELRKDLVEGRRALAEAATREGCMIVASGTAVLTGKPFTITEGARYEALAERYAAAVSGVDSEACGCHVHVGELGCGEAVTLAGHLRPWLPVLQALAVNSPFAGGTFRRCASWRHYQQQAWPTMGPSPLIPAADYESLADDLVASGVLLDRKMIYWYARPSDHQPTLEIRVADVAADVDMALLVATLTRALAMAFLADARDGVQAPRTDDAALREDHHQAAALGLSGIWRHPFTGEAMPLSAGVRALLKKAAPALEALDEMRLVEELLQRMSHHDTGAQRQRAVYRRRGRLEDVVDDLAARTTLT
ncbi:carboxylate-amine ligase [Catenulispora subtropica]|uniref:Putative glutamate--cysteine ligase 2 n=1 Tax=Catenulispora subtropica TaxID=450798 RepID=A0ABP5DX90_9ACTN